MAKKSNETIKNQVLSLIKQINNSYDIRLEKLTKISQKYFKSNPEDITEDDKNACSKELYNAYIDIMEEIAAETLKGLRKIYGNHIDDNVVVYHPWSKDGKDFDQRIWEHVDYRLTKYKATEDRIELQHLTYECSRILTTESSHYVNYIFQKKLGNIAVYAEVIRGDEDADCGGACEEHINGLVKPSEIKELPPYHPECSCIVVYYLDPGPEAGEG